jgi:hypothetical protein
MFLFLTQKKNITYLPHSKLSHNENWSFGDLVLANCLQQRFAIAYQYFWVLVQNTTLNGDKNQKKPIVTPGGAECGIEHFAVSFTSLTAFFRQFFILYNR